jgi:hypothetical protein
VNVDRSAGASCLVWLMMGEGEEDMQVLCAANMGSQKLVTNQHSLGWAWLPPSLGQPRWSRPAPALIGSRTRVRNSRNRHAENARLQFHSYPGANAHVVARLDFV